MRETELSQFAAMKAKMERSEKRKRETLDPFPKPKPSKGSQTTLLKAMVKIKPKSKLNPKRQKLKDDLDKAKKRESRKSSDKSDQQSQITETCNKHDVDA